MPTQMTIRTRHLLVSGQQKARGQYGHETPILRAGDWKATGLSELFFEYAGAPYCTAVKPFFPKQVRADPFRSCRLFPGERRAPTDRDGRVDDAGGYTSTTLSGRGIMCPNRHIRQRLSSRYRFGPTSSLFVFAGFVESL